VRYPHRAHHGSSARSYQEPSTHPHTTAALNRRSSRGQYTGAATTPRGRAPIDHPRGKNPPHPRPAGKQDYEVKGFRVPGAGTGWGCRVSGVLRYQTVQWTAQTPGLRDKGLV
jgi:hypothetical protein